jgi:hypothetical protein
VTLSGVLGELGSAESAFACVAAMSLKCPPQQAREIQALEEVSTDY